MEDEHLIHYGVLGMRWGIRRYQNKDGSLTPEGRKRLLLNRYDEEHGEDIVIKKGTTASRVVSLGRLHEFTDPKFGGSIEKGKKYVADMLEKDKQLRDKYFSVDGVRNSGRMNGKDYYTSWFTNEGYETEKAMVTFYTLNRDIKIASGKKVMDALIEELGPDTVTSLLKENRSSKSLSLQYASDRDLFDRINKKFKDMGYDGVEDINDLDTDMPIILFDSTRKSIRDATIQTGKDAVNKMLGKQ